MMALALFITGSSQLPKSSKSQLQTISSVKFHFDFSRGAGQKLVPNFVLSGFSPNVASPKCCLIRNFVGPNCCLVQNFDSPGKTFAGASFV